MKYIANFSLNFINQRDFHLINTNVDLTGNNEKVAGVKQNGRLAVIFAIIESVIAQSMELDACSAESLQFDYEEDESAATSLNEEECDDLEEFLSNTLTDCNLSDASVEDGYDVEEESVASNYVAKEYNDGDVEDSPLPEDIYQVLAEKDGLLKRLRDKLKNEKEKGAKSNEVNKNLQSEYERVLQRLAQCELHIDRLRLSSSNDHVVNKKLKVIYEVEKPVVQAVDPSHPFAQLHTPEPVASSSSPVRALSPSGSGLSDPFVSSHLSSDVLIPVAVGQNEGNAPLEERLPLTMPVQSSVSKEGITDSYPPGVRHDYCHGDTEQLKEAESPTLPQGSRGGRQQWLVPPSNSYTHHEGDTSDSSLQLSRVSSSASQKRKRQKKKITYSSSPEHLSSSRSSDQNCDNLLSALASLEAQQSAVTQKLNLQNGNRSGSEGLDKELESQVSVSRFIIFPFVCILRTCEESVFRCMYTFVCTRIDVAYVSLLDHVTLYFILRLLNYKFYSRGLIY